MSAYTPGPWHAGMGNGAGSIFSESGRVQLEKGGTTLYPIAQVNHGWNGAEDDANARLIAAAPELLAALQALVGEADLGELDHDDDTRALIDNARAAIERATGVPV